MQPPFFYQYRNATESQVQPSSVRLFDNAKFRLFARYLFQRAMSVFRWDGLPEWWAEDYFLSVLYAYGYIAVIETDKFGVIPQACGLYGYDVFYRPTHATVANPLLRGLLRPQIGTECEIIKFQPDYGGIADVVMHYAEMLALMSEAINVNLLNSHLAYIVGVDNKAQAEAMKRMYDKVASGEPLVVYDKQLAKDGHPWETFSQNLQQNYITPDLLEDMRTVIMHFDADIGLPSTNTDKKERLTSFDLAANNTEVSSRAEMWLENLQKCCERVNTMFGLSLSVDWRVMPDREPESEVLPDGNVNRGIAELPA